MASSPWNAEKIENLKFLWANGHRARFIAKLLGPEFTRNAVIGKAHRLKLKQRRTAPVKKV